VKAGLDLRAGDTRGRIYRVLPFGVEARPVPIVRAMSKTELVKQLDAPNGTLRDLVHLELLWRSATDVAADLKELTSRGSTPQGRLHALSVLDGLELIDATTIASVLDHERHPGVLRTAIRASEQFLDSNPDLLKQLARFSESADPQVRLQLAYTLGGSRSPEIVPVLARLLRSPDGDDYLRNVALRSVTAANIGQVLSELAKRQAAPHLVIAPVLLAAAETVDPAQLHPLIERAFKTGDSTDEAARLKLCVSIRQAFQQRKLQLPPEQLAFWDKLLNRCLELAADSDAPASLRVAALAGLPLASDREQAVQLLSECLTPQQPQPVQEAALRSLASMKDDASTTFLFDALRGLAPSVQAIALTEICSRQDLTLELLKRLEDQSLPRTLIDSTRKQQLVSHPNAGIRSRSVKLFAQPSNAEIAAQVVKARAADLSKGDSTQGRAVFAKHCAACHQVGDLGHEVGPALDSLSDRTRDFFVTAILDPNAAVDRRYANYSAGLTDGRVFAGILSSESEASITLKEKEGVKRDLLRAELETLHDTGKSMMPDGFGRELDLEDLRHLLAFLKATRLEATSPLASRQVNPQVASVQKITELMTDVQLGTDDEYRVIPPVWHVAIAAGRRNQTDEIKAILDFTLPHDGEPLRDWEAVVVGGGIVNGVSQANVWPARRIEEVIQGDEQLAARWTRTLTLSKDMSHNAAVKADTRYDALRIIALMPFADCRESLEKYLKPGTDPTLMQGAVSGLADVPQSEAAMLLAQAFNHLPDHLRPFALNGLARADGERVHLLDAIENNSFPASRVPRPVIRKLLNHETAVIRARAAVLFSEFADKSE
jgi:putative heme-binding domain-containing protein